MRNSDPPFPSFGFPFSRFFLGGDSAKTQYNEILANVDYLHGIAESFLTITNLLIVAAFRKAVLSRERNLAEGEGQQGPVKASLHFSGNPLGRLLVARTFSTDIWSIEAYWIFIFLAFSSEPFSCLLQKQAKRF